MIPIRFWILPLQSVHIIYVIKIVYIIQTIYIIVIIGIVYKVLIQKQRLID